VPDLGSRVIGPQAAALKGAQPRIGGPAVKADPGDGYLERMIEYVPLKSSRSQWLSMRSLSKR
jgi:hypothetical protein